MATSKKIENKLEGYFFMSINNGELDVNSAGNPDVLSAAFATIIISDDKEQSEVKNILALAIAMASQELSSKEKHSSKTVKKPVKKPVKAVNKK
jgi:hypothetical protein